MQLASQTPSPTNFVLHPATQHRQPLEHCPRITPVHLWLLGTHSPPILLQRDVFSPVHAGGSHPALMAETDAEMECTRPGGTPEAIASDRLRPSEHVPESSAGESGIAIRETPAQSPPSCL